MLVLAGVHVLLLFNTPGFKANVQLDRLELLVSRASYLAGLALVSIRVMGTDSSALRSIQECLSSLLRLRSAKCVSKAVQKMQQYVITL